VETEELGAVAERVAQRAGLLAEKRLRVLNRGRRIVGRLLGNDDAVGAYIVDLADLIFEAAELHFGATFTLLHVRRKTTPLRLLDGRTPAISPDRDRVAGLRRMGQWPRAGVRRYVLSAVSCGEESVRSQRLGWPRLGLALTRGRLEATAEAANLTFKVTRWITTGAAKERAGSGRDDRPGNALAVFLWEAST